MPAPTEPVSGVTLWILAQAPQPGMLWTSPATIIAIIVAVVGIITLVYTILERRKSPASVEAAETAANQVTFGNATRAEATKALEEANRIAARQLEATLSAEWVTFEFRVYPSWNNGHTQLLVTIRNTSPKKKLTVHKFGLGYGANPTSLCGVQNFAPGPSEVNMVEAGNLREFSIRAYAVAQMAEGMGGPPIADARLYVQFEHENTYHLIEHPECRKFLLCCDALRTYIKENPHVSHGRDRGHDLSGFHYSGAIG